MQIVLLAAASAFILVIAFWVGRFTAGRARRTAGSQAALGERMLPVPTQAAVTRGLEPGSKVVMSLGGDEGSALAFLSVEESREHGSSAPSGHFLAASSPLVRALADVGISSASLRGLVRVKTVGDAGKAIANGSGRFMQAKDGAFLADVVDKTTGKVIGKGRMTSPGVLGQVSPAIAWTALAYAVGQHFQVEIAKRLGAIESQLGKIEGSLDRKRDAELDAAVREVARMAGRLLDGESPDRVDAAMNTQIHCIESQWHESVLEMRAIEKQLTETKNGTDLAVDSLAKSLPSVFGKNPTMDHALLRFFDVLQGRLQLIALRTAQAASISADGTSRFQQSLANDVEGTRNQWLRVRELVHSVARLPYDVQTGRLSNSGSVPRAIKTTRDLLAIDDQIGRLEIPMITDHSDLADVLLTPSADGIYLSVAEPQR